MKTEPHDDWLDGLDALSEGVFGDAADVEPAEAEELLKAAGIDPAQLKGTLYRRMLERSEKYSEAEQPLPPLLIQAFEDLRPQRESDETETPVTRTARIDVARLLSQIKQMPKMLRSGLAPQFTAAYRNRKELSDRDKRTLDQIAEDLRKKPNE